MYYIGIFISAFFGKYAQIKLGRKATTPFELFAYSFVTGAIATVFFLLLSGFHISLNPAVIVYSAIYAVIVILIHFSTLLLYKYLEVSQAAVLSNTLIITLTLVTGRMFLGESVDVYDIIRCVLLIAASVIPNKTPEKCVNNKPSFPVAGLVTVLCFSLLSVGASAVTNCYSKDVRVTDSNSFFLMTNLFIVVFSALFVILLEKFNFSSLKKQLWSFSGKSFLMTAVSTVSSNVSSIFQMLIFAAGDGIIFYTPISGALGLVASGIISVIEKERPRIFSLTLACAALFIGLL